MSGAVSESVSESVANALGVPVARLDAQNAKYEETAERVNALAAKKLRSQQHCIGQGGCGMVFQRREGQLVKLFKPTDDSLRYFARELFLPVSSRKQFSEICALPESAIIIKSLDFIEKLKKLENKIDIAVGSACMGLALFVILLWAFSNSKITTMAQDAEIGGGTIAVGTLGLTMVATSDGKQHKVVERNLTNKKETSLCDIPADEEVSPGTLLGLTMPNGGTDLNVLLNKPPVEGRITGEQWLGMIGDAAKGFAQLHEQGILHRDIKPENLLMDAGGTVKICDFGFTEQIPEGSESHTFQYLEGTPGYSAPEVCRNTRYSQKSDVYALGITLAQGVWNKEELKIWDAESDPEGAGYLSEGVLQGMGGRNQQRMEDLSDAQNYALQVLINKMTDINPINRPTMKEVHCDLQFIKEHRGVVVVDMAKPNQAGYHLDFVVVDPGVESRNGREVPK